MRGAKVVQFLDFIVFCENIFCKQKQKKQYNEANFNHKIQQQTIMTEKEIIK